VRNTDATDAARVEALVRTLAVRLRLCSEDELRVLDILLRRLELGRERYGYLDLSKPRDWKLEGAEEILDFAIYEACDIQVKRDAARERLRAEAAAELARPATEDALVHITTPEEADDLLGRGSLMAERVKRRLPVVVRAALLASRKKACACPYECASKGGCDCHCHDAWRELPAPLPPPPNVVTVTAPRIGWESFEVEARFDSSDGDRLPDVTPEDLEDKGNPF
jgi:hypothetical protein